MAVMTHAPNPHLTLPAAAHYRRLAHNLQNAFDQHIEVADNAITAATFDDAMDNAAEAAGIAAPAGHTIARCDDYEHGCGCDLIFDAALPGIRVVAPAHRGNLDRLQCPDCAHDHPRTDT